MCRGGLLLKCNQSLSFSLTLFLLADSEGTRTKKNSSIFNNSWYLCRISFLIVLAYTRYLNVRKTKQPCRPSRKTPRLVPQEQVKPYSTLISTQKSRPSNMHWHDTTVDPSIERSNESIHIHISNNALNSTFPSPRHLSSHRTSWPSHRSPSSYHRTSAPATYSRPKTSSAPWSTSPSAPPPARS